MILKFINETNKELWLEFKDLIRVTKKKLNKRIFGERIYIYTDWEVYQ